MRTIKGTKASKSEVWLLIRFLLLSSCVTSDKALVLTVLLWNMGAVG